MRGYGLPRTQDINFPDVGDIRRYGLASHVGRLRVHGGRARSMFKNAASKAKSRRFWKRKARQEGKQEIAQQFIDLTEQ